MQGSKVGLSLRLEIAFKKSDDQWLAWCPPLDIVTQAKTKEAAHDSLKEAVHLWFESCVARGVLEQALEEVGFRRVEAGETLPAGTSIIKVDNERASDFSGYQYIEVSIPAYIAA
ncbi:MAG: type II toxin-antitoxin system HicB family antitoxin [Bryobacteraceae bacterium]